MGLLHFLQTRIAFKRSPDFVIGPAHRPYLRRWWVIPRNKWCNIYLHQILRDDDPRALHDHEYANCSIVLEGGYLEYSALGVSWRKPGSVVFRRANFAHRLALISRPSGRRNPSWSLFITGPRVREWGFWCGTRWVHWKEFTKATNKGEIGAGCEQ